MDYSRRSRSGSTGRSAVSGSETLQVLPCVCLKAVGRIETEEGGVMYEAKGILLCQSLTPHTFPGVFQGQEEGEGPLGHTRRFGRFWMMSVNDPPQSGTWEIQVTAKGTPRVRVQGKEDDIPGKGTGRPESSISHLHRRRVSDCIRLSSAQTSLDFLFHFGIPMEDGPHPGLYPLTQPVAGTPSPTPNLGVYM